MTTLGNVIKGVTVTIPGIGTFPDATVQVTRAVPFDLGHVYLQIAGAVAAQNMTASITSGVAVDLGDPSVILAAVAAWTGQDDDAHEPCSLTACRHPLHPGPCKGWKGTLHDVAPGAYQRIEEERVRKANGRRLQRIADLKAANKPIPRKLLEEIKPKPAPAKHVAPVPLGQVGQKADLAGGQAHHAGQAVSHAAGVQVKTAPPLPLGPKAKKPTVAGRGPAFVITQPKVTDQYKLDKAAKITPQEWAALSDADKTTIRNEITAIKGRGFGPQQKKADELLAKLPAPGVANAPGKVTLGQATKTVMQPSVQVRNSHGLAPVPPSKTLGTPPTAPPTRTRPDVVDQVKKASTSTGLGPAARLHAYRKLDKAQFDSLDDATQKRVLDDLDQVVSGPGGSMSKQLAQDVKDRLKGAPSTPAAPKAPAPAKPALKPAAPSAPGTAAHVQHARAVANRTAPKASMGKTHVEAYGKLSKAEFDALDPAEQRTIRDDLTNAKGKFLDPKKQQAAQDLLDRFGSRHTSPAPGAPAVPAHPKGYSDPVAQAVAAAHGTDDAAVLKRVGQLSHQQIDTLDAADKKTIIGRLVFIASHPKADQATKDKARALGRLIVTGKPSGLPKMDHEPSLNEIHAHQAKTGQLRREEALKAASSLKSVPAAQHDAELAKVTGLSKADFDALTPDEQRKVTDALQELHHENSGSTKSHTPASTAAGEAIAKYTGQHPSVHRATQAEADFRAGKIDGRKLYTEILHARVQARQDAMRGQLLKEEQRIAEDNPTLPMWVRASLVENKYGGNTYNAVSLASLEHNWNGAPRFSQQDFRDLFRSTRDDLKGLHPVQAEAVNALRQHVISTGLDSSSPWSTATKTQAVDSLLGITFDQHEVSADKMAEFDKLDSANQMRVRTHLADRILALSNDRAKTGTNITLRQLQGHPYTGNVLAAAKAATDSFPGDQQLDTYRHLDPVDFRAFPPFTQNAIEAHLDEAQQRAERGGAVRTWTPQDNALKVFPAALKAQLAGTRTDYAQTPMRNASDIANYGTGIVLPQDRIGTYTAMSLGGFKLMPPHDQDKVIKDLDSIAADTGNTMEVRYAAQLAKDIHLDQDAHLSLDQMAALVSANPAAPISDARVVARLTPLSKADFDSLHPAYKDAIDARVKTLADPMQQQLLTAKFHPAAPVANPAGVAPTVQANVPPHVQAALDTIYGIHPSGKSHTMAHQLATYGALRGGDFGQLNQQEQQHLLGDLSYIATTAKGPSADKARKLIDRFTPPGTPAGQVPAQAIIPPANAVPGQQRYATPLKGLEKATNSGTSGDGWISLPNGGRVWGKHGAAGLLLMHQDPQTGEKRYLMVQRGPAISDPGKWTFPGGASDSKETPHQGAARETIEELGLKDDALKDALIHGDHTYSVPGHSWKYTTVAAQVPTMIKPNLSTAHARAETSDAKWMTLDEIRALDKSGKLHHPIAGGKLEQNVISLYPAAPQTLGQMVGRPGPVTKRQGRLALPSGGRQAPTQFNAWPHAHKQSTGKNLVPDKTAIDKMRQDIKQARTAYDGKTADGRLAAIGAMQGYDDTPTVAEKKEIDRLLATGDYIEAWRGVQGAGGGWSARGRGSSGGKTAAQINEEMRTGPAYYGKGIFGNGYYLATNKRVAEQYSDHTKGSLVRILIPKSALTQTYDKVEKEAQANSSRTSKAKGSSGYELSTFWDPGRWGAAKGLDGIEILPHHRAHAGGGAAHVAKPGQPAYNWLNRSVLIIQKEPG